MDPLSFKRHRFGPDVIRHAVWLYFRFTLSLRDIEELLAERGIEVSYEAIRFWTIKFGPRIAANLRTTRPSPSPRWHLDEMVCSVGGKRMYLWRAVDDEGEILNTAMRPYRDAWTATKFLANLIINQPIFPERIVTDGLKSYAGAVRRLRIEHLHHQGRLIDNSRAENPHLPIRRRERKMQKFKSEASAQRFLATHAAVYNTFYTQTHLVSRKTLRKFRGDAFRAWNEAVAG
ncbi:MAG: putative transposase [Sphingomonadales bacterium]|nr:putative transposase [Sphingomonadales bacterium]